MTDDVRKQFKEKGAKTMIWYKQNIGINSGDAIKESLANVHHDLMHGTDDWLIYTDVYDRDLMVRRDNILAVKEL